MITLLELKILESEAAASVIDCSRDIKNLTSTRPKDANELSLRNKELKRLKSKRKRDNENIVLYKLIHNYLSSGVDALGIIQQRNTVMIKLSSIKEREKVEGINRELTDKENQKVIDAFETKYKVKKLKTQLRTLNFILK